MALTAPSPLAGTAEATLEYGPHSPVPLSPVCTDVCATMWIVAATPAPAAMSPRWQVSSPSVTVHSAPSGSSEPAVSTPQANEPGRTSVTTTSLASPGPALLTSSV